MNPDHPSPRAGDSLLRLAAYADGELEACARNEVERDLETNPAAGEELRDQERFSPANTEFWAAVAPPTPDEATWCRLRRQVGLGLAVRSGVAIPVTHPTNPPRSLRVHRGAAAAVLCASLLLATVGIGWYVSGRSEPSAPVATTALPDPLAEIAVLPVAEPGDVLVEAVYGDELTALAGYDSPMFEKLKLADVGDVTIEHIDATSSAVRVSLSGGMDTPPMIYVAALEP